MAAASRPGLATLDQGTAEAFAARLWRHIQLGQETVTALRLDHKHFGCFVIGEGPADRRSPIFRDQDAAVLFGVAAFEFAPVLQGEIGIATAVGLECRFIILESDDEGQDRRFVSGQTGFANTNGRAP